MKVKEIEIRKVIPYARNPRKNEDAISKVAASIKEFGWQQPVVVDSEMVVIAGHTRLAAARSLSMDKVPIVVADNLSPSQVKAYRLADNRVSQEAEWDHDLLTLELKDLVGEDYDLDLTGFSEDELSGLLAEQTEGLTDQDAVPDVPEIPVTVEGDIWVLGNHRLMCGDSTRIDAIEKLCGEHRVDMWLTDPPYNVAYVGKTKDALKIKNDQMKNEHFRQFLCDSYSAANANMKAGAVFYIWHADSEGYNFRGAAHDMGWQIRQCLIWKKQTMVMGRQDYHWKHEPCLYGWKDGAGHLWASDRKQTTILEFDRPSVSKDHPTMKPVQLFEYQILNNTKGGDLILDSFGGSGTTMIASEKNGRHSRLMELDAKYCDVIIKRWQDFTGKKAIHAETGIEFDG
tara:strand:- start:1079 stop:2278 length:1200 start_codon:yes stop_codon:yes gene_type:complete